MIDECADDILVLCDEAAKLVVAHKISLVSYVIEMMDVPVLEVCTRFFKMSLNC